MIISRAEIESAVSAYRVARKKKSQSAQSAQSVWFDTAAPDVEYVSSAEASNFAEMAAQVAAEPMYREALVNDLKRRVGEGKYHVPSEAIVEKLLGRLVLETVAG
jgi:anti-sigma28 factor (negative regulator of flagellin synthesis)